MVVSKGSCVFLIKSKKGVGRTGLILVSVEKGYFEAFDLCELSSFAVYQVLAR